MTRQASPAPSTYRGQIVESEAQRLAREAAHLEAERLRYRRAWTRLFWVRFGPMLPFGGGGVVGGATAAVLLALGYRGVDLQYALFAGVVAAGIGVAIVVVSARCPRCGNDFFNPPNADHERGEVCAHCRVRRGYLPSAEDLNDDEPGPG